MQYQPIVEITRGSVVESIHYGAIVVADPAGNLLAAWGDADTVTYPRSAAKPFQALPLLESSAPIHFGLTSEEIAVICASHSGTDVHAAAVKSILDKIGLTEGFLGCGTHPPFDQQTAQLLVERSIAPTPIRHNCSGKHSGMLALASFLNEPRDNYLEPQHPIQRLILSTFAEMCAMASEQIAIGIDGCSAPTFAVPIRAAATAYARLVDPSDLAQKRADACRAVFTSMTAHPRMVGGEGRFDTLIMQTTGGRVLSKGGAEGFQGFGISAGSLGPGSPGLGVAIKIADGNLGKRAGSITGLQALNAMGVLEVHEWEALTQHFPRIITNNRGSKVGEARPCFDLQFKGW